MPEGTPTPPSKPHRQAMVVFDLTDPRHREILRLVAQALRFGGQDGKAADVYALLEGSAQVVEMPDPLQLTEPEPEAEMLPDYFDGKDPAAGWPETFWGRFDATPMADLITEADLEDAWGGGPDAA